MGEIAAVEADGFAVVCADGRFKVTRVQADGQKIAAERICHKLPSSPQE